LEAAVTERIACVTGASGFIGSHLVKELLARGYAVRATVRDADDAFKTAHLKALDPQSDKLTLHSANLLDQGAFDDVIKGCQTVFHVASAVILTADDPQKEIVDPAVIGTNNVFSAINKSGSVTAVGLTSSIAAVLNVHPRDHLYTEDDWVQDATLQSSPYPLAKRRAEEAAWTHHGAQQGDAKYELVVVNPVLVTGPVLAKVHVRSSPSIVRDLMRGKFKGCPNLGFGVVDVRDVVKALANGVEAGGKTGRYILHSESLWMRDIAQTIAKAFPDRKILTHRIPGPLMYVAALFDKRLTWSFLRRSLGQMSRIDHSKVERELGIQLTDARQSIVDTCQSFVDQGFV
jgi:dihydroflavonol-4-reductase